jgi:hypothetical protein
MVRTRYIGSNRPREAGYSATHKQDFTAHVTGGDWIHLASHISVTSAFSDLQSELNYIESQISVLPQVVRNPGTSVTKAIPTFSDTTGKLIQCVAHPVKISNWGDVSFPNLGDGSYNEIFFEEANMPGKAQALRIYAQDNASGPGGDLELGCGWNDYNGSYDSNILLHAKKLSFDPEIISPVIEQGITTGNCNDLFIDAQSTSSVSGIPGNLWLESGVNEGGNGGDIILFADPGIIKIASNKIQFDSRANSPVIEQGITTGNCNDLYIVAQSTSSVSGSPGNLWLQSGTNAGSGGGDIILFSDPGIIKLASNIVEFDSRSTPLISQETTNTPSANDLYIVSQHNLGGSPGSIWLQGGYSMPLGIRGEINLEADSVNIYSSYLSFSANYTSAFIYQADRDVAVAADLTIAAQGIPLGASHSSGVPGNVVIQSGYNYNTNSAGNISLHSDIGQVRVLANSLVFGNNPYNGVPYNALITQDNYTTGTFGSNAQAMTLAAQNNTQGRGGDINIFSGSGYGSYYPHYAGDDGNISLLAGLGSITMVGSSLGDNRGGINLYGTLFLSEITGNWSPVGAPVGGVYLFVYGGNLYLRDTAGADHLIHMS